ncbi:FAD/FMN-containing dehydrogenase [Inquilinus ginsengisoli]|uniref:FAD-binding oxidoreductase n=1 Tax=Inquilinus ginsengisoli TaxID=363840 RepID=UPI003D21349E
MNDTASHLQALGAVLGERGLLAAPDDLSAYETGARYDRGRAAFVARPATTAEASAVVAHCVRHGIRLVPQGGNTGLVAGSTPDPGGAQGVLSLDRLAAPFDIDPANRSATVGAGLRLSALNQGLAPHGLVLPIDLGADPMVGGMVATNTGGARFIRYGDMRRHVLGLEVVLPDAQGTVLDLMRPLRKNNTGLDLKQLFIGTGGAYGLVTRAVLELRRLPQQSATAILVPRDDDAVMTLLTAFEERVGDHLAAFEGISGAAVGLALKHHERLRNPFAPNSPPPFCILVEIERSWAPREQEPSIDALMEQVLAEIWDLPGSPLADAMPGRGSEFWALRHVLSESLAAEGRVVAFDLGFARADVMPFRRAMTEMLAQRHPEARICDFGHVGDGGVHFNLVLPRDSALARDPAPLRELVFGEAAGRFGGSFSAEHGIGRVNLAFYERFVADHERGLAGAIQDLVAPGGLGAVDFRAAASSKRPLASRRPGMR